MTKLRLAIFNTQPPHIYSGGVERRIIETTKRLQTHADITVYSGTKAGFKKPLSLNGVNFVPCYSTNTLFPLDNWFFNRSLKKNAISIAADVFEAHAVSGYGYPRALKKLGIKKPVIHTIHGVLADEYEQAKNNGYLSFRGRIANNFMHRLAKLESEMAHDATLIVTISEYSLKKIKEHYQVDASKVRIVPNGVAIEKFKPLEDTQAAKQNFELTNQPTVLFVGSLIPRKGLTFLVEAARKVVKEKQTTQFLIVGEGPLHSQLTKMLASANLTAHFRFLGKVSDDLLPSVYNCADVFVLPSIQEGQGIVLLEAQACGKPVVAFDLGGINEAVHNGVTGLLVPLGNTEALANALLKLLDDESLRVRMGVSGRRFVSDFFTWDTCAEKMLKVYQEVAN